VLDGLVYPVDELASLRRDDREPGQHEYGHDREHRQRRHADPDTGEEPAREPWIAQLRHRCS
jgi:hypothetical protein